MLTRTRIRYNSHAVFRSKIRLAEQFIGEINNRLKAINEDSFEHQELSSARRMFILAKLSATHSLQELPAEQLTEIEEARRRQNEILESQQVASKLAFVDRLKAMGDFRQAKTHLLSVLQIRAHLERESAL